MPSCIKLPSWLAGCFKAARMEQDEGVTEDSTEDKECAHSHALLHLSAVTCKCCPQRYVSLQHSDKLCKCEPSSQKLVYRHSLAELEELVAGVHAQIQAGAQVSRVYCSE